MSTRPMPSHYHPDAVGTLFIERGTRVAEEARRYAIEHAITASRDDAHAIALVGIDAQVGFCSPGASLFVPGAVEDTRRAIEWIYRNLAQLTSIYLSLDTHRTHQIFHPDWWRDEHGAPPAPFTRITADDVSQGRFTARHAPEDSARDLGEALEIWPYHTLLGGLSHALVPSLMEATIFHAIARDEETHFSMKGTHPTRETYSAYTPELFAALRRYARVYIFGEAKSHCVLATLEDLVASARDEDARFIERLYVLTDAMSPVGGGDGPFAARTEKAFAHLAEVGVHLVTTRDEVSLAP